MNATSKPARRGFLALLSGAAAVPMAAALPAVAATSAPAVTEAPELLAIGDRLPDITARISAVRNRLDEAIAAYERLKPSVPPEIIAPEDERSSLTETERGLDGEPVRHEERGRHELWDLYNSRKVKAHMILREMTGRTKEGKRLRRIARLAEKFEKDRKAAISASGYREASVELLDLRMELQDDFAAAALAIKPLTMKGLGIYASIIAVGSGPARRDGYPVGNCEPLAVAMAEAFVAINGGGAS
jgi:hypothetical protein